MSVDSSDQDQEDPGYVSSLRRKRDIEAGDSGSSGDNDTLWTDWDLGYRRSGPERHFDHPEDQDYWDWDYRRFDRTRRFDLVRPDSRQDSREDSIMSLQGPIQTL